MLLRFVSLVAWLVGWLVRLFVYLQRFAHSTAVPGSARWAVPVYLARMLGANPLGTVRDSPSLEPVLRANPNGKVRVSLSLEPALRANPQWYGARFPFT